MRAIVCSSLGPPEDLEVADYPVPVPAHREVLVEVAAAGVNFPDLLIVQGLYQFDAEPPFVPGSEGAGTVVAVGDGVSAVAVGDEVLFTTVTGAFAERAVAPEATLMAKPGGMTWEEAAAFRFAFGTSYHALKQRGRLAEGETLLVLGAAGGVGSAAVQLGKAMGATVIAAASSPEKLAYARSLGADHVVDYSAEDLRSAVKDLTAGRGADVVYDPVGGDYSEQALRATAWEGRYLVVGFAAGGIPRIPLNLPLLKGCAVVGVFWGTWMRRRPDEVAENVAELTALYEQGRIAPQVMEVFALEDHREAFALLSERRVLGKVVLAVARRSS